MTNEEKELREIREAAGVGAGYSHEDLVILVRNAVPQIARALELMQKLHEAQGQLAALRSLLDDHNYTIQYLARADTGCDCDPSVGMGPCLECEIRRAAREFAFMLGSPANGKPEAGVIAAAIPACALLKNIFGALSTGVFHNFCEAVERMEEEVD